MSSPSFEELFASLKRPIFGLCLRLSPDRPTAEDVFQDVWLAVHVGLPRFRGESLPATWVYRIALRTGLRATSRRRVHDALPEMVDPRPNADEQIASAESDRVVAHVMGRLSAEHRTVLSLFAVEDLSHRDIAAILGVPEGTVWSRLHAARKRFAGELVLYAKNERP